MLCPSLYAVTREQSEHELRHSNPRNEHFLLSVVDVGDIQAWWPGNEGAVSVYMCPLRKFVEVAQNCWPKIEGSMPALCSWT